jgi:POT family proton-dependent oligopeptide transporter
VKYAISQQWDCTRKVIFDAIKGLVFYIGINTGSLLATMVIGFVVEMGMACRFWFSWYRHAFRLLLYLGTKYLTHVGNLETQVKMS